MTYTEKKVGNVTLHLPSDMPRDNYTDKDAEEILLELFSGSEDTIRSKRHDMLADNPTWPLYYHLTPKRANLLRWSEFEKGAAVLEIGAGCGAITEELITNDVHVTALELAEQRATINALRNKMSKNLDIIVGNLEDYKPAKKFDYIVCVGVLEYAGTFIHSDSPYEDFMKKIHSFLKPGGKFLLAIENRFGMKYWTGAKEDHVHTYFEGHNNYPGKKRVQTFGRKELANLFLATGFSGTDFYYPFPDYKNPSFVYSDSYYPGNGATFPLGTLPTPTLDRGREHFMAEQTLMPLLEANGLFPDFSNSFLVEGTK